jgi:N-acetylneuraminate lyase
MSFAKIPGGKYAPGAEAGTVPAKTIRPFPTLKLYIANEAFHPADWGEGSLEMAENVVHKFFGVAPPSWIAAPTYRAILFGPPDAPSPPPPPGPGPTPSPPTPGPPSGKKCPPQQLLNATIVCVHTVDLMDCNVTLACPHHSDHFVHVDFADIGTPRGACGGYSVDADCSGAPGEAAHIVAQMCLGQPECSFGPNTNVLNPSDPMICDGVVKSMSIQLSCGTGTPVQPPPAPPPPSPSPPSPPSVNSSCAGPFGKDLPPLLRSRPSGTAVPDWLVMAAPFTPFYANGSVNTGAVLPLAKLFKERLGITAVWVMGMRGQFDAMTVAQRKAVAEAWVRAGKATGLFTIIQCGSSAVAEAAEVAAFVESIGGDAIGSLGPFEELCSNTECVVDWVAPVAAAAPHTPFFYYHTPGWNGKSINGVKMYDWFRAAETKIPTNVGVKFESYSDEEFKQTCAAYGETKVMIYAPCGSLGHFEQGTPGRGAFIQAAFGPMCHRIKAAYDKGDTAGMHAAAALQTHCDNAGGNFVERYFYGGFGVAGVEFGPPLPPQPTQSPATLAAMNETLHKCGSYEQRWP